MKSQSIADQVKATPTKPGVYIFRDSSGTVLYVGKAASLRSRVRSYFADSSAFTFKLKNLSAKIAQYEYVVTDSEQEALILENTLIKGHKPRYNVRLKDDKTYPYIKIDLKEDFPRVYFTRRREKDGARYFGPFASASSVRKTLDLIKKLFPYRSCTKNITGTDPRPCLDYYINRCVGPCIGVSTKEDYRRVIDQVILFLEGKHDAVVRDLKSRMGSAAEELQFERAAALRDQVRAIQRVSEAQKVHSSLLKNEDLVAMARSQDEAWVEVFFVREGKTVGRDHFIMVGTQDEAEAEIMASFVKQYYDSASYIPPLILLQHAPEDSTLITRWLENQRGQKVKLRVPKRGVRRQLLQMVAANAVQGLAQHRIKWLADIDAISQALDELQEQLNLPSSPRRMECYDISNIQGTNPVGSMVVFENGRPKPSHYRRFKIKTVEGIDDYSMMQEMLRRRFRRLKDDRDGVNGRQHGEGRKGSESWGIVPDLVLIDGGKGHLSAALQVMLEMGVADIPLASIAKQFEEIFRPDSSEPIILPRSSQALYLVQRLRDEAHRFAITFHRQLRKKSGVRSAMDSVPGIGPKRKKALIRHFGSVKGIREAPIDDIAAVVGMTRKLAQQVKEHL
ncbi:MAG: excinuclease ABC subunit UvrC [Chloroflexi bacterium]|nr:excinuclease ABC subunit UvrC [Chloroflexota bacterium]